MGKRAAREPREPRRSRQRGPGEAVGGRTAHTNHRQMHLPVLRQRGQAARRALRRQPRRRKDVGKDAAVARGGGSQLRSGTRYPLRQTRPLRPLASAEHHGHEGGAQPRVGISRGSKQRRQRRRGAAGAAFRSVGGGSGLREGTRWGVMRRIQLHESNELIPPSRLGEKDSASGREHGAAAAAAAGARGAARTARVAWAEVAQGRRFQQHRNAQWGSYLLQACLRSGGSAGVRHSALRRCGVM